MGMEMRNEGCGQKRRGQTGRPKSRRGRAKGRRAEASHEHGPLMFVPKFCLIIFYPPPLIPEKGAWLTSLSAAYRRWGHRVSEPGMPPALPPFYGSVLSAEA